MKKTLKEVFRKSGLGLIIIGSVLVFLIPLYYWISNPELSQMQVFFATWRLDAVGLILWIIGIQMYNVR